MASAVRLIEVPEVWGWSHTSGAVDTPPGVGGFGGGFRSMGGGSEGFYAGRVNLTSGPEQPVSQRDFMSKRDEAPPSEDTRGYALCFVVWLCSLVTTLVVVVGARESDPIVAAACLTVVTILFAIVACAFRSGVWTVVGTTVVLLGLVLLW